MDKASRKCYPFSNAVHALKTTLLSGKEIGGFIFCSL
jgi:hypothetical protein